MTPKKKNVKPKSSKKTGTKTLKKSQKNVKPKSSKKTSTKTLKKSQKIIKKSQVSKLSLREKAVLNAKLLRCRKPKVVKKEIKSTRGVVYLSKVPHGFYENEMKHFFSQFGQVTGIRIPKSTRTGKYKGYAFVEFMFPEVAKIAAETMNNYLMYKRVVKAKYLPPEEQKPHAFKFPPFQVPLTVRRKRFLRQQSNRVLTEKQSETEKKRLNASVERKLNKLKKLGINYEFQVANRESTRSEETKA